MFDNPFSFVKFFGILIAAVYLIYRFRLIMMMIDGFKKWRIGKDKYEADKLKYTKLQTELDNVLINNDILSINKSEIDIQLLKIVKSTNQFFVYLLVVGGAIAIKSITSKDFNLISIEPKGYITNNSSAYFSFTKVNSENNLFVFEIIFEDELIVNHSKKYSLSVSENILKEIK